MQAKLFGAAIRGPGGAGTKGDPGDPGAPGQGSFSVSTAPFVQPEVGGEVNVDMASTAWLGALAVICSLGQVPGVEGVPGYYRVKAIVSGTRATLELLDAGTTFAPVDTAFPAGLMFVAAGEPGAEGPAGTSVAAWTPFPVGSWVPEMNANALTTNVDLRAIVKAGMPVKVLWSTGATSYQLVTTITAGAMSLGAGPPLLQPPATVAAISWGDPSRVVAMFLSVPGAYAEAASTTLLASVARTGVAWPFALARVVRVQAWARTVSAVTRPKVNVLVNGVAQVDWDGAGIEMMVAQTWASAAARIIPATAIPLNAVLELSTTIGDGAGADSDLCVQLVAVFE
jgi:hypothetical protein